MTFKFKSQATSDLLMLSTHAQALLVHIGKPADPKGILTVAEMPAALAALKALPTDEHHGEPPAQLDDADARVEEPAIDLHRRAWPLVQMIEESQAANQPIVWGV